MKKSTKVLLSAVALLSLALPLSACGKNDAQFDEQLEAYNLYVANAQAENKTYMTYEEWLNDIKGEKGEDGKNGSTVTIGTDGYWYIDGERTNYKAVGSDGSNGANGSEVTIGTDGYWYIDGVKQNYKAAGSDGNGIASISSTGTTSEDGTTTSYTITLDDGSTTNIVVTNGTNGASVTKIEPVTSDTAGKLEFKVTYSQGQEPTYFYVDEPASGNDGAYITKIEQTESDDETKYKYEVTFSDSTTNTPHTITFTSSVPRYVTGISKVNAQSDDTKTVYKVEYNYTPAGTEDETFTVTNGTDGVSITDVQINATTGYLEIYTDNSGTPTTTINSTSLSIGSITQNAVADGATTITYTVKGKDGETITTFTMDRPKSIVSITPQAKEEGDTSLVDTYVITYNYGNPTTFTVTNGEKGATGNGIDHFDIDSDGYLYAYYTSDTSTPVKVGTSKVVGTDGAAGSVIKEITANEISADANDTTDVITYTVTYTDEKLAATTFTIPRPKYVVGVELISTDENGLSTYKVVYNYGNTTDNETLKDSEKFTVQNGATIKSIATTTDKWGIEVTNTYTLSYGNDLNGNEITKTVTSTYYNANPTATYLAENYADYQKLVEYAHSEESGTDVRNIKWVLDADLTLDQILVIDTNTTIDLNGHTITSATDKSAIRIAAGTVNITGKGTIDGKYKERKPSAVQIYGDTGYETINVTIGKDVTLKGAYGLAVFDSDNTTISNLSSNITVNFAGKINGYSGLSINGNVQTYDTGEPVTINILSTANITATNGSALYLAGYGVTTVEEGATLKGAESAVEIRAGQLIINGGTFTATNTPTTVSPNGNGTTTSGAALAIAQHTTTLPIDVTVNGGTFNAAYAIYESNPQGNATAANDTTITVNGGVFNGLIYSLDETDFLNVDTQFSVTSLTEYNNMVRYGAKNILWTLADDVVLTDTLTVSVNTVINLNGHSISLNGETDSSKYAVEVNNVSLEVVNNPTTASAQAFSKSKARSFAKTFENSATVAAGTIQGVNGIKVTGANATVTITSGTVAATSGTAVAADEGTKVAVNGGTVVAEAGNAIVAAEGTKVAVSGGTVVAETGNAIVATKATVTLTDGNVTATSGTGIVASGASVQVAGAVVTADVGVEATNSASVTLVVGEINATTVGVQATNSASVAVQGGTIETTADESVAIRATSAQVTVQAGNVTSTGANGTAIVATSAIVNLDGGSVIAATGVTVAKAEGDNTATSTVKMSGNSSIIATNVGIQATSGSVELSGGTIQVTATSADATATGVSLSGGASATISGGTIESSDVGLSVKDATVQVTEQSTSSISAESSISVEDNNASVAVQGGTISGSVTQSADVTTATVTVTDNVKDTTDRVTVEAGKTYTVTTVDLYNKYVTAGATSLKFILSSNVEDLTIAANTVLDLNGKTVSASTTSKQAISIANTGLTIIDSSLDQAGKVNGTIGLANAAENSNATLKIQGGMFTQLFDYTLYDGVVANKAHTTKIDGTTYYTTQSTNEVGEVIATIYDSEVGNVGYEDLVYAIKYVEENETIKLIADTALEVDAWGCTEYGYIPVGSKTSYTIDLDGHTVTDLCLIVDATNVTVTVQNGTLLGASPVNVYDGKLVLNNVYVNITKNQNIYTADETYANDALSIIVWGSNASLEMTGGAVAGYIAVYMNTGTATINNAYILSTTTSKSDTGNAAIYFEPDVVSNVTVENSIIEGGYAGIAIWGISTKAAEVNTTDDYTSTASTLTVKNTTISDNAAFGITGNGSYHYTVINVIDSTITGASAGIYNPQYGTLTISGKSTITGETESGVEIRAGSLTVSDTATIISNGTPASSTANGNGTTTVGAAVSVVQHTTKLPISVTINSGVTLTGFYALYENNTQGNSEADIAKISVTANIAATYTGMIYSGDNLITLEVSTADELTKALTAASSGVTVKLTADIEVSAIPAIANGVTLDLNGKTLTTSQTTYTAVGTATITSTATSGDSVTRGKIVATGTPSATATPVLYTYANVSLTISNVDFETVGRVLTIASGSTANISYSKIEESTNDTYVLYVAATGNLKLDNVNVTGKRGIYTNKGTSESHSTVDIKNSTITATTQWTFSAGAYTTATLDNVKLYAQTANADGQATVVEVNANANVEIKNSTVSSEGNFAIIVRANATLTLDNVELSAQRKDAQATVVEVQANANVKIKNSTVSSAGNFAIIVAGTLTLDDVDVTSAGLAIQIKANATAEIKNGSTVTSTAENKYAIETLTGSTLTIDNSEVSGTMGIYFEGNESAEISNSTITASTSVALDIRASSNVTVIGSTITSNGTSTNSANNVIQIFKDAILIIDSTKIEGLGEGTSGIYYPYDKTSASNASVTVRNGSIINTANYAISTNANSATTKNIKLHVSDSTLTSVGMAGIMINVPVENIDDVTITNSKIYGLRQAVIIRGGKATITNSTLGILYDCQALNSIDPDGSTYALGEFKLINGSWNEETANNDAEQYTNGDWSQGAFVYTAVLTLGDCTTEYNNDTEVVLSGVTFTSKLINENGEEVTSPFTTAIYSIGKSSNQVTLTINAANTYNGLDVIRNVSTAEELSATLAKAQDGDIIKLNGSFELDENITVTSNVTIDLNGYTITLTNADAGITIGNGTDATVATIQDTSEAKTGAIVNGTVEEAEVKTTNAVNVSANSTLTIKGGTYQGYYYGVEVYGTLTVDNGTIISTSAQNNGIYAVGATVTVNGGTITGDASGIYATSDNKRTNDNGGDKISVVIINGGTISGTNTDDTMYFGHAVEINGGSTLTVKAGTLTGTANGISAYGNAVVDIQGGTISGKTGMFIYNKATATISGESTQVSGTNYGIEMTGGAQVTVNGGTVIGETYSGVYTYNGTLANNTDASKVIVSNGTVYGKTYGIYGINATITVSDGTVYGKTYSGIYINQQGITNETETADVTISGGTVYGKTYGVSAYDAKVVISDGTVYGATNYGILSMGADINVEGGTIVGTNFAIALANNTTTSTAPSLTVTGGTIIDVTDKYPAIFAQAGTVDISGGTIVGYIGVCVTSDVTKTEIKGCTFSSTYCIDVDGTTATVYSNIGLVEGTVSYNTLTIGDSGLTSTPATISYEYSTGILKENDATVNTVTVEE